MKVIALALVIIGAILCSAYGGLKLALHMSNNYSDSDIIKAILLLVITVSSVISLAYFFVLQ